MAICNSSVQSAQNSVNTFKLPKTTKVYGDPQDLANDQEVDLVVCTVRVDRHYKTIAPAIKAGKNVMVEWPLGKNLQEAEELLKLSKEYGVKIAAVGCQGRFDSTFRTVKKLIDDDEIGKVLSTTVVGAAVNGGRTLDLKNEYLGQVEVGGNMVTIPFAHFMDAFIRTLGEPRSFDSIVATQRPTVDVVDSDGSIVKKGAKVTSHDHILIHGRLGGGILFSINVRGGNEFKGEPGVDWRIYGQKGEIFVKAPNMHMQIFGGTSIRVHDLETDLVKDVEFLKGEFDDFYPVNRNVARAYEAIAAGDTAAFCSFEQAVERHRFIEAIYKQNTDN